MKKSNNNREALSEMFASLEFGQKIPNPLEDPTNVKKKLKLKWEESFDELTEIIDKGTELFGFFENEKQSENIEGIKEISNKFSSHLKNQKKDTSLNPKEIKSFQKKLENQINKKNEEKTNFKTLKDTIKITEEEFQLLFQQAAKKMDEGKVEEAVKMFKFLTVLNPLDPFSWLGLGISTVKHEGHEAAAPSYKMALELVQESNPMILYWVALYYLEANEKEKGRNLLESTLNQVLKLENHEELKKNIENTLETI